MEFSINNVYYKADEWEVTSAIASQALHRCPGLFVTRPEERLPNFKVQLNKRPACGVQNDGTGTLTLTKSLGRKFRDLLDHVSVKVKGKRLKFFPNKSAVEESLRLELEKAPFVDPEIARDRAWRVNTLCDPFYVSHVQIGTFYCPREARPGGARSFSIEWEEDLSRKSMGLLFFEYEHKCLRVQIGDRMQEQTLRNVIIRFSSINEVRTGHDSGNPYICFDLLSPPVFEKEKTFRCVPDAHEKGKYRQRVGFLDIAHKAVSPYAHQLRLGVLFNDVTDFDFGDVLKRFEYYCRTSSLHPPKPGLTVDANDSQNFFCRLKREEIAIMLRSPLLASNWRVAFQVEALLRNGVANTVELIEFRPRIANLIHSLGDAASDVMRRFVETAAHRPLGQHLLECFDNTTTISTQHLCTSPPRSRFLCHHVTFTPTRVLLEGPILTQSNQVIRQYSGYEDRFLRVEFRDEDRLQYRWDRAVDGASYLQERVGTLLKRGFNLAGRHFDFLGYSSSALKEHAVWYVNPFQHPTKGRVTAQSIRNSLGDFSGVIKCPSKYGARMAQAFSGTDPSVRIRKDQWSEIPDIVENGINFTDGVGTISPELAQSIWEALCEDNPALSTKSTVPSAYQIRFLGCKGVVSVDSRLEGIQMCVRPSMKKFDVPWEEYGTIEIAQAFGKPNIPYLNRPLVMVLEDRGTPKEVFMQLQNDTVAKTRMAHNSPILYAELLESHQLCYNYRLAIILRRLDALRLELPVSKRSPQPLDTPFLARLRVCAINHALRTVKYEARLYIPDSYMLVGVADEGPAYVKRGVKNVYCLPQGKIFACVQTPQDEQPRYLKGMCIIYRNPVIHPGDVQRVYAIGPPPDNQVCLFEHLKNVVVFSSTGTWSLPNGLAGGDLDGDAYVVSQHGDLLVTEHDDPASYPPVKPYMLDRPSTMHDICDFIVEYIYSDVVGIVSNKHITIADQSNLGTRDPDCLKLARMHSLAVDYPKSGNKVDIGHMPKSLIKFKPDWDMADPSRPSDFYRSNRALGYLYRNINLEDIPDAPAQHQGSKQTHPITRVLNPLVLPKLPKKMPTTPIEPLYSTYCEELTYMSSTYALSRTPGSRLREEELVIGTILATSTQKQYRSNRLRMMRENVGFLVNGVREQLVGKLEDLPESTVREKLGVAWAVWKFSLEKASASKVQFGSESFGLIGLGLVLDCLEKLGCLSPL